MKIYDGKFAFKVIFFFIHFFYLFVFIFLTGSVLILLTE